MKSENRSSYAFFLLLWLALALLLGTQALAASFSYAPLNWLGPLLDEPPHLSNPFIFGGVGLLCAAELILYFIHLNPWATRRSARLVFLNALGPAVFCAMELVAWDHAENRGFSLNSMAGAPLALLLPPLLLLGVERLLDRFCLSLGGMAQARGWRHLARSSFLLALALRPDRPEIRRRAGLLALENEECAQALRLLEPLGAIAESQDEAILRGMEHCYRDRGEIRTALECLLRLQRVSPDPPYLERRILDDYVRLGMNAEALELLDSGCFKPTHGLLLLSQKLNVEQGNYAQAIEKIRRLGEQEGPPYSETIDLYRGMIELLPENIEVKINLGLLLLDDQAQERRQQGAALLEQALARDGHRLYLSRRLVQFYSEAGQRTVALAHMRRLVEAGDPTPDYYLAVAQQLTDEGTPDEGMAVLRRMVEVLPKEWRGYGRLARAYFLLDELEPAEAALARAEGLVGDDDPSSLQHLRIALEQRRRERYVASISEDLASHREDVQKRLDLLDHLLGVGRVDQALSQSDALLEEFPDQAAAIETHLRQSIQLVEHSFRLRDYLADLCFLQGRYDDALEMYRQMAEQSMHPLQVMIDGCRKILQREPGHLEARRELALACRGEENWEGIIESFDPPLADPESGLEAEDKALWVEAAYRLGRLDDAARVGLTISEALAPETGYMLMLIDILQETNDFEQAYAVFEQARAASPENERLLRLERRILTNKKKHQIEALQQRLTEKGELTAAEHFAKAELHRDLGEFERAIVHFQHAADEASLTSLALAKMAATLCDRGMFDLAEETLAPIELTRESAAEHPELKEIMYTLGRAMEKLRKPELATKYYKRIFRVDASYRDVVSRLERLA